MQGLLSIDELSSAYLLVLANKQDMPGARSAAEIAEKLRLRDLSGVSNGRREWNIQSCCALTGDGLFDGLEWISKKLKERK